MYSFRKIFLISFFLITSDCFSQVFYYRVSADISIKEVKEDVSSLNVGKLFYDIKEDILVYNMFFPHKVDWIINDTSFYIAKDNSIIERYTIPKINSENILRLSLTNTLNDYGLIQSGYYKLTNVTNDQDMLISIYEPINNKLKKFLGKIIISLKGGQFHGVVFFNPEGDVLKKLIIQDFILMSGIFLPKQIIEIIYKDTSESYKLTSFSNFKLNEKSNENYYNYNISNFNK